jgi:hypothetical protein
MPLSPSCHVIDHAEAFGGEIGGAGRHDSVMDLGKLVSRKKDFVPAITKAIKAGWSRPKTLARGPSKVQGRGAFIPCAPPFVPLLPSFGITRSTRMRRCVPFPNNHWQLSLVQLTAPQPFFSHTFR